MKNRCYCKLWSRMEEDGELNDVLFTSRATGAYIGKLSNFTRSWAWCPFCGKPLAESKSQQNRLEIQLKEKKDA